MDPTHLLPLRVKVTHTFVSYRIVSYRIVPYISFLRYLSSETFSFLHFILNLFTFLTLITTRISSNSFCSCVAGNNNPGDSNPFLDHDSVRGLGMKNTEPATQALACLNRTQSAVPSGVSTSYSRLFLFFISSLFHFIHLITYFRI